MRRLLIGLTSCLLLTGLAPNVTATTREWAYPLPEGSSVSQVIADDVGGVAFTYAGPEGDLRVVWLDSKGRVSYQRGVTAQTPILGVNNRALVLDVGEENKIVIIDRGGEETDVAGAGPPAYGGSPLTIPNKITDLNGFFAVTFGDSGSQNALVRYSY